MQDGYLIPYTKSLMIENYVNFPKWGLSIRRQRLFRYYNRFQDDYKFPTCFLLVSALIF